MLVTMLCSSFVFGAMPLLLAFLGAALRIAEEGTPRSGATMLVRMGYTLGWSMGAPLGELAARAWGYASLALAYDSAGELRSAVARQTTGR